MQPKWRTYVYHIYGSASALIKKIYKNSDKRETLLMEMAVAPAQVSILVVAKTRASAEELPAYIKPAFFILCIGRLQS